MKFRPLTAQDVKKGAIVYILGDDIEYHKKTIEEVLKPSDNFKGYVADDGCRYGLYEAYRAINIDDLLHTVRIEIARYAHSTDYAHTEAEVTELLIKGLQK